MNTEYKFVDFNEKENPNPTTREAQEVIAKGLAKLLEECEFILTDFGLMWPSKELKVSEGFRGPTITSISSLSFTWWYNIKGGYKLCAPLIAPGSTIEKNKHLT